MDTYLSDADSIFNDFRNKIKTDHVFRDLSSDEQLEYYQKQNHEFAMTFPITLRYMIQFRQYNRKAFEKFIGVLTAKPYRSVLEYCERQADYVKYLYMETSTDYTDEIAEELWKKTYDILAAEVEMFEKSEKMIKDKSEKNDTMNDAERREELKMLLK